MSGQELANARLPAMGMGGFPGCVTMRREEQPGCCGGFDGVSIGMDWLACEAREGSVYSVLVRCVVCEYGGDACMRACNWVVVMLLLRTTT